MSALGRAASAIVLHAYDIPILIGRAEARQRAEQELAKAKYGGTPDWVTRALDRVSGLAERFIELLARLAGGPAGAGAGINWGFLIAIALLLAAIAIVVWRVGLPRWRKRTTAGAVEADPTVQPTDYRTRAEDQAAAGDWRGAVRDRFRALVRELETRTILDVRPARTALETAAGAGRHLPALAGRLWAGAEEFNAVVYGEGTADEAAYRRMVALDDDVTAAAGDVDLAAQSESTAAGSPTGVGS
jgi:hypothetical protein